MGPHEELAGPRLARVQVVQGVANQTGETVTTSPASNQLFNLVIAQVTFRTDGDFKVQTTASFIAQMRRDALHSSKQVKKD